MSSPNIHDASPEPPCTNDQHQLIHHDDDNDNDNDNDMAAEQQSDPHSSANSPAATTKKAATNSKDPTRPRRKKARRACFSCQRAHLTCGDERPCTRCIKRNLQDSCMDGVRKKAKYLHDAPDGALMPGMNGHYPHMHAGRPVPHPAQPHTQAQSQSQSQSQDQGAVVSVAPQQAYYTQAPPTTYYASNPPAGQPAPMQDAAYSNPSAPISPQYNPNQTPIVNAPSTQPPQQQMQQFGGPLFDPSDPALFNFDISSLNFGNHYGALELGMLGHMSSGAVEPPASDNPMNQAAAMYNPQMPPGSYNDQQGIPAQVPFGPDGIPSADWQTGPSRHGSMQIQTPNNTPVTVNMDHGGHRHDSLNGPHAYAIGQGPPSISSASPASTDVHSGYDDNTVAATAYFANADQAHAQRSPMQNRPYQQTRIASGPLQPVQSNNAMRNRQMDGKSVYERVTQPYDYVKAFHRLIAVLKKKFNAERYRRATADLGVFRPVLVSSAATLTREDLLHAEKSLQRLLVTMHHSFAEVGTPCLICRRTGEIVGMNKEFEILTGWKREVLLGHAPNRNANFGPDHDPLEEAKRSGNANNTPTVPGQEADPGPHPVNILEVMDEESAIQYLDDFSDLAYEDPLGKGHRRVNLLRYQTKEEMARSSSKNEQMKREPRIKHESGSIYQGEAAMRRNLGTNGLIDAMIMWHIKRDNFEMPMLVAMQIMPMLKP